MYVTTQSRSSKNGSQTHFTDREAIRFRVFRVFRGTTRNRGQTPRDSPRAIGLSPWPLGADTRSRSVRWAVSPKLDGGWAGYDLAVLGHRIADRIRARIRYPLRIAQSERVLSNAVCTLLVVPVCGFVVWKAFEAVFHKDARS